MSVLIESTRIPLRLLGRGRAVRPLEQLEILALPDHCGVYPVIAAGMVIEHPLFQPAWAKPSERREALRPNISASFSCMRVTVFITGVNTKNRIPAISAASGRTAGSLTSRISQRAPRAFKAHSSPQ